MKDGLVARKLDEDIESTIIGINDMPGSVITEKYHDTPVIQHAFTREKKDVKNLLPDGWKYIRPLGAASWKESHLVHAEIDKSMLMVINVINETNFVKEFRHSYNISRKEMMKKELLGGNMNPKEGLSHVLPIVLKDGTDAILEEYLPQQVSKLPPVKDPRELLDKLIGFSKGYHSMHVKLKRVYGDAKSEHFMYDVDGVPKIRDYGTSSQVLGNKKGRIATGDFLYRSLDTFRKPFLGEFKPKKEHDIFSFGAVAYFMATGKELHQEIYDEVSAPLMNLPKEEQPMAIYLAYNKHMEEMNPVKLQQFYNKKVKDVPKPLRDLVAQMIATGYTTPTLGGLGPRKSIDSIRHGGELKDRLVDRKNSIDSKKYILNKAKEFSDSFLKSWKGITTGVIMAGLMWGVHYTNRTFEPKKFVAPKKIPAAQYMDMVRDADESISFDREPFVPAKIVDGDLVHGYATNLDGYYGMAKNNFHLVNLTSSALKAMADLRKWGPTSEGFEENFYKTVNKYHRTYRELPRVNIHSKPKETIPFVLPESIDAAKRDNGEYVDVEDMMLHFYGGETLYNTIRNRIEEEAKKGTANIFQYQTYKNLKDESGELLISEDIQEFINKWNTYLTIPKDFLHNPPKTITFEQAIENMNERNTHLDYRCTDVK